MGATPSYRAAEMQKRALGSCLHVITDSYAVGHTQRRLLNGPEYDGRDAQGFYRFKSGTYGRWGPVITFHTYEGQDGARHKHYDNLPGGQALPTPKNLESFNNDVRARDAIAACTKLINFWVGRKDWDKEVRPFLETDAQCSNTYVDAQDPIFSPSVDVQQVTDNDGYSDLEYNAGLWRKLASLEEGTATELVRGRK
jgi:hypothetical protein